MKLIRIYLKTLIVIIAVSLVYAMSEWFPNLAGFIGGALMTIALVVTTLFIVFDVVLASKTHVHPQVEIKLTDGTIKVDKDVAPLVAALNKAGVNTIASCQGDTEDDEMYIMMQRPPPWIEEMLIRPFYIGFEGRWEISRLFKKDPSKFYDGVNHVTVATLRIDGNPETCKRYVDTTTSFILKRLEPEGMLKEFMGELRRAVASNGGNQDDDEDSHGNEDGRTLREAKDSRDQNC